MSAATAPSSRPSLPARPQPAQRSAAASLRLVPAHRSPAPRTPFVAVVVAVLAGGLLGLLGLNTLLAQNSFRLHSLAAEGRALDQREQVLRREVEALRTPRNLAAEAAALGMVPAGPPAFLRLSDGAVLGAEVPAQAPPAPPASAPAAGDPAASASTDTEPAGTEPTDNGPAGTENAAEAAAQ